MARRPEPAGPGPAAMVCAARVAFPTGHRLLRLRAELGTLDDDARVAPQRWEP